MQLQEFIYVKAAEESTEITKAFTKTLTFGIDSVDPKNGKTNRQKIVEEVNDLLVFLKLCHDEGIELPGIGDPEYLKARTEKALAGMVEARKNGLITDVMLSVEEEASAEPTAAAGECPVTTFLQALGTSEGESEMTPAETLARRFHETYERLAPEHGYETREETREFDPATPNGKLMVAVCDTLLQSESGEPAATA